MALKRLARGKIAYLYLVALLGLISCKSNEELAQESLDQAIVALKSTDFGETWDATLATLTDLSDPKRAEPAPASVQAKARFWQVRTQLALFLTALVTENDELFAHWQRTRGWKLEGKLTDLINFQSTVQEISYDLDKVQANDALSEQDSKAAQLMAKFARTTQGVFYRDKRQYIKAAASMRAIPELSWMDDALALRDLLVETTGRPGPGMGANWQNVVLTVVGRVCGEASTRHVSGVCTVVDLQNAEEFCPAEWDKQAEQSRVAGAVLLLTQCKTGEPGAETLRGLEAIRFYYDAAFDRLASSKEAPSPLVDWAKEHRDAMSEAYAILQKELFMGMTQEDLRRIDEKRMIESLAPRKKGVTPSTAPIKAPSNHPKQSPVHLREGGPAKAPGHEGHGH